MNDTVILDIVHIESPQGGKGRKRVQFNIKDFLHKKRSIITIQNKDDLCLARALVVAIARIEKAPNYKSIVDSRRPRQEKEARELHGVANVPLGPCGLAEVQMFQKHLTQYEINIISADHNNTIIYPSKPMTTQNVKPIYLYLHHNHMLLPLSLVFWPRSISVISVDKVMTKPLIIYVLICVSHAVHLIVKM